MLASASNRTIVVPRMHELTAAGLAGLCGLDMSRTLHGPLSFEPGGMLTPADRVTFEDALGRARGWRR